MPGQPIKVRDYTGPFVCVKIGVHLTPVCITMTGQPSAANNYNMVG